jgi:hypothetical protein
MTFGTERRNSFSDHQMRCRSQYWVVWRWHSSRRYARGPFVALPSPVPIKRMLPPLGVIGSMLPQPSVIDSVTLTAVATNLLC